MGPTCPGSRSLLMISELKTASGLYNTSMVARVLTRDSDSQCTLTESVEVCV